VLLAAVYKSPSHTWNDAGITDLLSFRHKLLLAGDMNAKHAFWNSVVYKHSGAKLLNLLHINEFEISAPQCPTHYSPARNDDVLNIVQKNVQLSFSNCWITLEGGGRTHSPRKGRKGDTPLGYSGQTALRREQCDMSMRCQAAAL
jgi:hypothetical protein